MDNLTFTFSANGAAPKQTCRQCRLRKVRCQGKRDSGQRCLNCERLEHPCSFNDSDVHTSSEAIKPEPRRISKACVRCRQQKIRCSGSCPCTSCRRKGTPCEFPNSTRRKPRIAGDGALMSGDDMLSDPDVSQMATPAEDGTGELRPQASIATPLDSNPAMDHPDSPQIAASISKLVDFFFQHVYPLPSYAFLHPATTRRRFEQGQLEVCLVYAISAAASVRAPSSIRCSHLELWWAEQAESMIWHSLESPTISRLQTMLLVVLFRAESGHLRRAFMLSSLAGRAAAAMRLNLERPGNEAVIHEVRRRLMWSLKLAERYFSHGLPEFELCPVENLYIQLPCSESRFRDGIGAMEPVDDLCSYRTCVKLEMLRRDVMKLTRSLALCEEPYPTLPQLIKEFQDNLDKIGRQLPDGPEISQEKLVRLLTDRWLPRHLLMRLSWHQCQCDLHRLILRDFREAAPKVVVDNLDPDVLDNAERKVIHHATSIAQILATINQESQQQRLLEFDSAICAYNASRLLLFTARFGRTECKPSDDFAVSRAELCLASMKRFFPRSIHVRPIAREMRRLIDEAASNGQIAPSRLGSPRSSAPNPRDPTAQLSAAGKARNRLAIHSLLRQAGFSDDEDEPDDTRAGFSSPHVVISPSVVSSATANTNNQVSPSASSPTMMVLSNNQGATSDGHTPSETHPERETWEHNLFQGDLLHGRDLDNAAPAASSKNVRSFTFPWLMREQADWPQGNI